MWNIEQEFRDRMQCIADLYSGFEIADAPVIGIKTLGENMADSGGTKIAHQALLEWYEQTTGQKTRCTLATH
jgi:predicted metalloendopeptidase